MPHQSGNPDWSGGNPGLNPGMGGGGKPSGAGTKKGTLFGDQIVLYRDLDPTDGGGNGEPILDLNGQLIAVGYDPGDLVLPEGNKLDDLFPIYMANVEGDYEFPAALIPYLQEVELERANVSRAPAKVTEKALAAALVKVESAYDAFQADTDPLAKLEDYLTTDPAGRIMYRADTLSDFATVDSPLENLALFQALMTAGGATGWPEAYANWATTTITIKSDVYDISVFQDLVGASTLTPDWDPSALLGGAWSKEGLITLDAMLYENTTLGLNTVDPLTQTVTDYFDFVDDKTTGSTADDTESYDYSREGRYGGDPADATWLRWTIDVGGTPEYVYATVYDAVFGGGDASTGEVLPGQDWVDQYLFIDFDGAAPDPLDDDMFTYVSAENAGVNDFAQAADDSRAVIEFIHTYGAVVVDYEAVPDL